MSATDPNDPAAAWVDFCERLKAAGESLRRPRVANDPRTLAEGHRHLVRLVRLGFECLSEYGDPDHPRIAEMATETMLSEGVTGDARYHQAHLDGRRTYVLRGTRGTAPLIEISIYTGRLGLHETAELQRSLTEADLAVDADGGFEVTIGPEPTDGNWLETDDETRLVFIRQYAQDWAKTESGTFTITCTDVDGPRPPLEMDELRTALERTADFVTAMPAIWGDITEYWVETAPNRIVPQETASSDTDIVVPSGHRFACGYFRLEPDEALVVRFRPPETAAYWGLHLDNYWYEPLDWVGGRAQVNDRTAVRDDDGRVTLVIADREPPDAPNWVATCGHVQGSVVFRWSRTDEACPVFDCAVAPVEQWREGLDDA